MVRNQSPAQVVNDDAWTMSRADVTRAWIVIHECRRERKKKKEREREGFCRLTFARIFSPCNRLVNGISRHELRCPGKIATRDRRCVGRCTINYSVIVRLGHWLCNCLLGRDVFLNVYVDNTRRGIVWVFVTTRIYSVSLNRD